MTAGLHAAASGNAALAARNDAEAEARRLCKVLTVTQRDALVLAAKGLPQARVAVAMGYSRSYVEVLLSSGRITLGVETTIEAAVILTRAGLV